MTRAPFVDFSERALGIRWTPWQRVAALVAFDDVAPKDLEPEERAIARRIFGDLDEVPPLARAVVVLIFGRGSGKDLLLAAFALYVLGSADVSTCGPGDTPIVVAVAPDRKTGTIVLRYAIELARRVPSLRQRIESESAESFVLRRPDGRKVEFAVFAASRGGATVRGRTILLAVLDESCFFRSDDQGEYQITDTDVYSALIPRLVGKCVFISTPWPAPCLTLDLFKANHGAPQTALAGLAKTLDMRPDDARLRARVERERRRDPVNCAREFDCDWTVASGGNLFFPSVLVDAAVDHRLPIVRPRPPAAMGTWVPISFAAGADVAFQKDASACVIVGVDTRLEDPPIEFFAAQLLTPTKGQPLVPSETVAHFARFILGYDVHDLATDSHYIAAVAEELSKHNIGLTKLPEGQTGKVETYSLLRRLFQERRIKLAAHERLVAELKEVRAFPQPGGGMRIVSPRRAGSHGDLVSALVAAVWRSTVETTIERAGLSRVQIINRSSR